MPKAIPPRNETYEFIIFRGSDIKDLHVSEVPSTDQEMSTPEDPAIVSAVSYMDPLKAIVCISPNIFFSLGWLLMNW